MGIGATGHTNYEYVADNKVSGQIYQSTGRSYPFKFRRIVVVGGKTGRGTQLHQWGITILSRIVTDFSTGVLLLFLPS